MAELQGIFAVKLPVRDLAESQAWYERVFGLVTELEFPDADGVVRTRLMDPISGRTVTQSFGAAFTQCVVYTPGHREAICVEPYTCVPDAIRLAAEGHATGLQVLQPGESFETTVRIEVS